MADRFEKTESATPKRRREAREKGQVAKSSDLSPALILLAVVVSAKYLSQYLYFSITRLFTESYSQIPGTMLTVANFPDFAVRNIVSFILIVAPVILITVIFALAANYAQVGFLLTAHPLKFDLNRLNPANGFKRIFSKKALFELVKSIGKILIVGYVVYTMVVQSLPLLTSLADMELSAVLGSLGDITYNIAIRAGLVLLFLALLDYLYQRHDFEQSLKMTKKEIRDEMKQQEGDPLIKSRIRQKQRQIAMRRMMQEVPEADVIITNPTHFAIAIKYNRSEMSAPKVVAKGQRLIAERIKKIAEELKIPVVEDKPLARALYKAAEIGDEIPVQLYQAVAEILAMIYRLNRRLDGVRVG